MKTPIDILMTKEKISWASTSFKELEAIKKCERIVFSSKEFPIWLSNNKWLALKLYTYNIHIYLIYMCIRVYLYHLHTHIHTNHTYIYIYIHTYTSIYTCTGKGEQSRYIYTLRNIYVYIINCIILHI